MYNKYLSNCENLFASIKASQKLITKQKCDTKGEWRS